MAKIAGLWKALMWITLVPVLGIQILAMIGISMGDSKMSIVPLVAASVLLLAAAILFGVLREKRGIAMILAAVSAVLFVVVAITVYKVFELNFKVTNVSGGITSGEFVYRHLSPLLVVLFMLFYWICWRADYKAEKARREASAPDHYIDLKDFSMAPVGDVPVVSKKKKGTQPDEKKNTNSQAAPSKKRSSRKK